MSTQQSTVALNLAHDFRNLLGEALAMSLLSLTEIARRAGIERQRLLRLLAVDSAEPTLREVADLMMVLGCHVTVVVERIEQSAPPRRDRSDPEGGIPGRYP